MLGQKKSSWVSEIMKFKGERAGNVVTHLDVIYTFNICDSSDDFQIQYLKL